MKGWQNQQDYGARIYDPRIGRFLSIDPLSAKYPWYTAYQFAGNKPIRFVDIDGLEEADISKKYLPYSQDMSAVPTSYKGVSGRVVQTTYNLHGYAVNYLYFWEKNIKEHPEFLDAWNKGRVLNEGKAPIFTYELKAHFEELGMPVEGLKIGDIMEHHHINQGRTAIPITRTEHDQIPTQKNPAGVKVSSKSGRISAMVGKTSMVVGSASDFSGLLTGDPDATINWFGPNNEIGKLYKNLESGLYYMIMASQKDGAGTSFYFNIYSGSEWDKELGKFVGTNQIGYGESYQEKKYQFNIVYDMEGKPKSVNTKGTKEESLEDRARGMQ